MRDRLVLAVLASFLVAFALGPASAQTTQKPASDPSAVNALIIQANAALQAKEWQKASDILKQIIALDTRWDIYQGLGNAQLNLGQYQDALSSYDTAIKGAQNSKSPSDTADKMKAAVAEMLTNKGNAYLKLRKTPEAMAAFSKAVEISSNSATAYFNLCAAAYNTGDTSRALIARDKAIKLDPKRADAYFIKGSVLLGNSITDAKGKLKPPPGTVEALTMYLKLAPDGAHAGDVKEMLAAIM